MTRPTKPRLRSNTHKRRPLRPDNLAPPSRRWYDHLLANRPRWLENAFNVLSHDYEGFNLEVVLPHPQAGRPIGRLRQPAESMQFSMNHSEEVTLDWWHGHAHFDDQFGYDSLPEAFADAVAIAEAIMNETYVVVGHMEGAREGMVSLCPLDAVEAMRTDSRQRLSGATSLVVRSWNATHDRRIKLR